MLYGEPRLTRDIDITLGITTDRLNNIIQITEDIPYAKLIEKNITPDDSSDQMTFKFKILSSVGTDYIVQYPASEKEANKNSLETKNIEPRILRIPKAKVLLVEYQVDSSKQGPTKNP